MQAQPDLTGGSAPTLPRCDETLALAPLRPLLERGRILELDGLRALAVLAVIAYHYTLGTPLETRVTRLGWMGVDLFFVLSGFLITNILLRARARPAYFRTFYSRRTLRIFPIYFLLLAIYVGAAMTRQPHQPWAYWGMHAAFLSASVEYFRYWGFAAPAFVYAGVTVLWSLSIEEQFYLIWAPVVRYLRRDALWLVLAAAIVGAPWIRFYFHTSGFNEYRFLPARCDSLAWGAVLALGWEYWWSERCGGKLRRVAIGYLALVATTILLAVTAGNRANLRFATFGYTCVAVCFALVLGLTVRSAGGASRSSRCLRWQPAVWLGKISYCVYLIHYPLLLIVGGWTAAWWGYGAAAVLGRDMISLAAALLLAAASWRWIEAPALQLKPAWAAPRPAIEPVPSRIRIPEVAERVEAVDVEPVYDAR